MYVGMCVCVHVYCIHMCIIGHMLCQSILLCMFENMHLCMCVCVYVCCMSVHNLQDLILKKKINIKNLISINSHMHGIRYAYV